MVDGAPGHEQPLGDVRVAKALTDEAEDLELARRQGRGVRARRGARAPADGSALLPQPPRGEVRQRPGAELERRRVRLAERVQAAASRTGVVEGAAERVERRLALQKRPCSRAAMAITTWWTPGAGGRKAGVG